MCPGGFLVDQGERLEGAKPRHVHSQEQNIRLKGFCHANSLEAIRRLSDYGNDWFSRQQHSEPFSKERIVVSDKD
jgi:hypothetical protein